MTGLVLTVLGAGAAAVAIHRTTRPAERRRAPLPPAPTRTTRGDRRQERPGPIDGRRLIR